MNQEDIIRMARETGVEWLMHNQFYKDHLQRFAALVAAYVRETEFKPDWMNYQQGLADGAAAERNSWPAEMEAMERQVNILTDALAQAKAEERKIIMDSLQKQADLAVDDLDRRWALEMKAAIRARGETK